MQEEEYRIKYNERGFPIFPGPPKPVFPDGIVIYYAERKCVSNQKKNKAKPCTKNAIFIAEGQLLCGVHARHRKAGLLPRNPRKPELIAERLVADRVVVEEAAEANLRAGRPGQLIATKLLTYRACGTHRGFMKVFPNYRHGGRRDGMGCPSLSPLRLGPVFHNQPGLPVSRSIENCCNANCVYPKEADGTGEPLETWHQTRLKMYNDIRPNRLKAKLKRTDAGKPTMPLYSVWVQPNGAQKKFSNVAARQFFCCYYERLVSKPGSEAAKDLESLRACLAAGYNLEIVGYNARPVTSDEPVYEWELLERMYLDPSLPFGHELVLYTMLSLDNPEDYPWRRYKSEAF